MIKLKHLFLATAMAVALTSSAQTPANYRPQVYPMQQETVGGATLDETAVSGATHYRFANQVLDATFVKQNDRLTFGGSESMDLEAGTELFTVKFDDGTRVVTSNAMTLESVITEDLTVSPTAVKGADHFAGKRLKATFTYAYDAQTTVTIVWTADLRDGSHYLKTNLDIKTSKDVKMFAIIPMRYAVNVTKSGKAAPAPVGDTRLRGRVVSNDKIFALLDTPTAINTAGDGNETAAVEGELIQSWADMWEASSWNVVAQGQVPQRITELALDHPKVSYKDYAINIPQTGALNVAFHYAKVGNHRLNMCGVELIKDGQVVNGKYHIGYTGNQESNNVYSLDVTQTGNYTIRMYVDNTETIDSKGNIDIQLVKPAEEIVVDGEVVPIQGLWSRNTTLKQDAPWSVGGVVGLVAPGQNRRSVLAYLERERAVPWRPFPIYNSWYELNIDRTNKKAYDSDNLKVEQTVDVLQQWKTHMFDTQGVSIKSFVWDDGWDKYGTWDFNAGFPNGFKEPDVVARQMCSAQGAWLGPCGGYDVAGNQRKAYWANNGGCNLHNPKYYEVFFNACKRLCDDYQFNYFKFDGISTLSPAYGPAAGTNGEEDAEGIINIERNIRGFKPDIFFNTTVGTWASTAWLNISDAVWRHHGDHGYAGSNPNKREQWITYRDQYIYQHYVVENPLMTINSMMSHGFMLSNYGEPKNMPKDYDSVLRELRCAFACGSGQVELYSDYSLLNSIEGGKLWKDMADLVKWQRRNADVLPDIHWVGGDPAKEQVYGWAAWNGNKAVLTLRNGKNAPQTFTLNLRKALNIPEGVNTQISLTKTFADQAGLQGLTEGQLLDIDTDITVTLPGSTVYMFDGLDRDAKLVPVASITFDEECVQIPVGRAKAPAYTVAPLDASDKTLVWTSDNTEVATVNDGAITGKKEGTAHITATATNGVSQTITVTVIENLEFNLETLIEEAQADYNAHNIGLYGDGIITLPSQFSSNASDSQEGTSFPLLDDDGTTFWHSNWHNGDQPSRSHYLQVTLPETLEGTIQVEMMRRINGSNIQASDVPLEFDVEVSATGNDGDWTSAGSLVFDKGSMAEPKVYDTFTVAGPYRFFRFWCTKTSSERGYFHVGDFQLHKLEQEAPNTLHATEAAALMAALEAARNAETVTSEVIKALQDAYDTYKAVIGKAVVVLNGFELPIPNGVYEIINAPTRDNRGYLVDYTAHTHGPSLAECRMNNYQSAHPAARNSETTSSYWYVHEKDGKYYIVSLSDLQTSSDHPRFIVTGANAGDCTTYTEAATPLTVKEHATYTYTEGKDTYKYMLIGNEAGTRYVSAACGTNSNNGSVKTDTNTDDGGAPWKFIRSNVALSATQLALRANAIRLIENDATIVRLTQFVDKAHSGETTLDDVHVVRNVILKK